MSSIDVRRLRRDIESCARSHAALVAHLAAVGELDPTTPSRLPGWTVGHVLTHLARNADGHLSMLAGGPQYPHGAEGRNADIETGALRTWRELVDDVIATAERLDAAWAVHDDWTGTAAMLSGNRPTEQLPLLRQREVEIHRVDLGLGAELGDLDGEYVRRDLGLLEMQWKARRPMGMGGLPDGVLALDPPWRLAWMLGRHDVDGVAPAELV